ncbi:MAG: HhH-GPD family protein [Chlorobi bacterium]|nr:HhH-GPD family protein [Chlorobiota bacterium]
MPAETIRISYGRFAIRAIHPYQSRTLCFVSWSLAGGRAIAVVSESDIPILSPMIFPVPDYLPLSYHLYYATVRERLPEWFAIEGRSFPWRSIERAMSRKGDEIIHDPYMILVSEVMLQQTQTARVVEKLPEFLALFPTVEALASASRGDLIRAWRGMGYNRRALRLQEAAVEIVRRHHGIFPRTVAGLESLPGIGRYTASAVACFAFGADVPVVDVNIHRVYSRMFFRLITAEMTMPAVTIERLATTIVPPGDAYRWHQALMDFGATICTARRPACSRCPLNDICLSAFPRPIELFDARQDAKKEPEIRGVPRRIWRGQIVERLRGSHEPIRVSEIIDSLGTPSLFDQFTIPERRDLLEIFRRLMAEGFIVRGGVVREGELQEGDMVMLPL